MQNVFLELGIVLSLVSVLGFVVQKFKLPLIISYLLAGVILSAFAGISSGHFEILEILPEIGISFVLFLIGMELDLSEIKNLGIPIIVSAIGQVVISTLLGFYLAGALGFGTTESLYLGLSLAFSSTVVVIKILLEKKDLNSLYGKLSMGILLIEDLVAIIALMVLSVGSSVFNIGFQSVYPVFALVLKALGLFVLTFILSKFMLKKIFDFVAKSQELLFLTAITWCFVFTSLAVISGFSVVIGSFLAGVALASSPYHIQIQSKIKPLRDFFLTLFFVYLGTQVKFTDLVSSLPTIFIFTIFAILVKPFIYSLILATFGFKKHTIFQTSLNLSQISEFSLIVLLVGVQFGLIHSNTLSIMASVAVLSIIISSISINFSKQLYKMLSPIIGVIERKTKTHLIEAGAPQGLENHIVVIGAHRVGGPIVKYLKKTDIPFLVMDFNPTIVKELNEKNINAIYGDMGDPEVIDKLELEKAKLIISTASDLGDNELLLEECVRRKTKATVMVRADDINHSKRLKEMGAQYIVMPEKVTGVYLVNQLKSHWPRAHFAGLGANRI